jgi:20S proteasome subunit alpha 7
MLALFFNYLIQVNNCLFFCTCSIYIVHDEVKDKHFELELSWVGAVTQGRHQKVSQEVFAEVERYAKSALEDDSDSGNDDM